jgi:hypothetical protein
VRHDQKGASGMRFKIALAPSPGVAGPNIMDPLVPNAAVAQELPAPQSVLFSFLSPLGSSSPFSISRDLQHPLDSIATTPAPAALTATFWDRSVRAYRQRSNHRGRRFDFCSVRDETKDARQSFW